jgi:hypothetical protein
VPQSVLGLHGKNFFHTTLVSKKHFVVRERERSRRRCRPTMKEMFTLKHPPDSSFPPRYFAGSRIPERLSPGLRSFVPTSAISVKMDSSVLNEAASIQVEHEVLNVLIILVFFYPES